MQAPHIPAEEKEVAVACVFVGITSKERGAVSASGDNIQLQPIYLPYFSFHAGNY